MALKRVKGESVSPEKVCRLCRLLRLLTDLKLGPFSTILVPKVVSLISIRSNLVERIVPGPRLLEERCDKHLWLFSLLADCHF